MESKGNGKELREVKKLEPEKKAITTMNDSPDDGPKESGYFLSHTTLNKLASIIDEMPTKYGVAFLKILQEELRQA